MEIEDSDEEGSKEEYEEAEVNIYPWKLSYLYLQKQV
jgi:hypothetical protein